LAARPALPASAAPAAPAAAAARLERTPLSADPSQHGTLLAGAAVYGGGRGGVGIRGAPGRRQ
jgi:hypothetical protein